MVSNRNYSEYYKRDFTFVESVNAGIYMNRK